MSQLSLRRGGGLHVTQSRVYLRGGGVQGVQTPPRNFQIFWKSEGKEVERKREKKMKRDGGGGGGGLIQLNC